ncbi:hypothetical protein PRZ48_012150 [Zasmidium cellare]|uniref:DUF1772 domain-containing protein n=1 Tax=Zasmidium cellare TaxID=395010 RepID=A0ABR0E451_ZASCE|nr:hypothetical protein PRZ48_012150 [Zasmidium cellare]
MALLATIAAPVPVIALALTITLFFVSGIAWCFNLWVIPLIRLNTSDSAIDQHKETVRRGGVWLEPLNAAIAASFAILAGLSTQHASPEEAALWKYYAAASFVLVQVAWWERVFVFSLDDAIAAMKDDKTNFKGERPHFHSGSQPEFHRLLSRWMVMHAARPTLPFIAAVIALWPRIP